MQRQVPACAERVAEIPRDARVFVAAVGVPEAGFDGEEAVGRSHAEVEERVLKGILGIISPIRNRLLVGPIEDPADTERTGKIREATQGDPVYFQTVAQGVPPEDKAAVILVLVVVLQGALGRESVGTDVIGADRNVIRRSADRREREAGKVLADDLVVEIDRSETEGVRESRGGGVQTGHQHVGLVFVLEGRDWDAATPGDIPVLTEAEEGAHVRSGVPVDSFVKHPDTQRHPGKTARGAVVSRAKRDVGKVLV